MFLVNLLQILCQILKGEVKEVRDFISAPKSLISSTQAEKMRCQILSLINGNLPCPYKLQPALLFQFLSTIALLNELVWLGTLIYWNGPVFPSLWVKNKKCWGRRLSQRRYR